MIYQNVHTCHVTHTPAFAHSHFSIVQNSACLLSPHSYLQNKYVKPKMHLSIKRGEVGEVDPRIQLQPQGLRHWRVQLQQQMYISSTLKGKYL